MTLKTIQIEIFYYYYQKQHMNQIEDKEIQKNDEEPSQKYKELYQIEDKEIQKNDEEPSQKYKEPIRKYV